MRSVNTAEKKPGTHQTPQTSYTPEQSGANKAFEKFNLMAQSITDEIIKGLEKGDVFWKREWKNSDFPKNTFTARPYRGFNALYLNFIAANAGYRTTDFITYRQAAQMGGHIREGEKGTPIIFWKIRLQKVGEKTVGETKDSEDVFMKKYTPFIWTVFNIDQTEGITFDTALAIPKTEREKIILCEETVKNMPLIPEIKYGSPCYDQISDVIRMPEMEVFDSSEAYYSTLYHELIHSTKHKSRLDRNTDKINHFGDENYSKEELIAEVGANFLCAFTGIRNTDIVENSTAYLNGWISKLKNDPKMIVWASVKAFKAASYICRIEEEYKEEAV